MNCCKPLICSNSERDRSLTSILIHVWSRTDQGWKLVVFHYEEIPQFKFLFDEIFCLYVGLGETGVVLEELECIALSSRVMAILLNFRP